MKFSLWPDNDRPPAELLDEVRYAEAAGWHGVWLADHYMPNTGDATPARGDAYECWGLLPALAAVTERVRIGTLVSPTSVHHPALLAKRAATIDRLSGGRMVLGLGAGWQINEHHAYGIELEPPGRRVSRFEEAIRSSGRCWRRTPPRSTAPSTSSPTPPATPSRSSRRCRSWSAPAARGCSASPRARRTSGTPGERRSRPPSHRAALLAACDKAGRDPATMRTSVNAFIDLDGTKPPGGRATLSGSAPPWSISSGSTPSSASTSSSCPTGTSAPVKLTDTLARIKTEVLDQLTA